ncbi:MAG: pyruvate:ferredoxin (flavodoxin) oxidoreductase [Nanoarchaeota archaeon]|nr:pyruvate:ferredoxin (flavodoxin) oxidoreductase [Nanoarchaeota archaeon]MBU1031228.1 pyruvate:ferredoxin (flavodoxin) oxidoreductase [Nanoarchaeota archaeon]MBU1849529.1 pyruvate:ferredoxin (flavodoxin) oxidoreductase [Nanoarchaeota archaeon]
MKKEFSTIDGNTAAANVAYAFSEVAAIYPITPATSMGEMVDEWAAHDKKNLFGSVLKVAEMQSEAGAAGSVHGALSAGAMTTTFTASQGLLLMLPNMFKIAGEMLPTVFHIAARSIAAQALSIFCDHSDIMAARSTGFAIIAASNPQEVQDLAIVAHLSTLETRVPFLAFFDGFRTSSEIQKIEMVDYKTMKSMLDIKNVEAFRKIALSPERPVAKVGAENPDIFFQGRETTNKYYQKTPLIVKKYMNLLKIKTGRKYELFEYVGHKEAEKIIISMGSSCDTIEETTDYLVKKGEKVGAIKVKLYRPFYEKDFLKKIPPTVKKIAVLDRTKEPGAIGEPLYLDIVGALKGLDIEIIGGRYGLSSKEFTPSMVKAVYNHLDSAAFHGFTVGIKDDVTNLSIPVKEQIDPEPAGTIRCKFWGLGSDGTVGANKNSIKIIGENTDMYAQGFFSYDSKKSGGITISHLRFGKKKIKAPYLLTHANFIALHNHSFIGKYDILEGIIEDGTFLINSPWNDEELFKKLTKDMQDAIIKKKVRVYNINATKIAKEVGLGGRINTVMQTAFFILSGVLPENKAITLIKNTIKKTFEKKGKKIVEMNWKAVDKTKKALRETKVPKNISESVDYQHIIGTGSDSKFVKEVIEPISHLKGDTIPVSKIPLDGAIPTGTTRLEKRGISTEVPHWYSEKCIQCGMCSFVCPHAAIRVKQINSKDLKKAPKTFKTVLSKTNNTKKLQFKVQVFPEDCTGCNLCVEACPVKDKAILMNPIEEERVLGENQNAEFFEALPDNILDGVNEDTIKGTQLKKSLFEFSGACAGCGETPYIKLLTQLFGDRMIIANATGCSSIYGGTFPTIPYTKGKDGRGPAWANSLFEDNAEYGYGMMLAVEANREHLQNTMKELTKEKINPIIKKSLNNNLKLWNESSDETKNAADKTKELVLKEVNKYKGKQKELMKKILELKDYITKKSIWAVGGDGWAYDIGFGGLDHVLAQKRNINILVLDTEVYSNTGGQASKATPLGAVAKFAASGKKLQKKNLGLMMMSYEYVYIASVSLGANKTQLIKAFKEAEAYDGPSIIIAYSPCIAHGIDMKNSQKIQKKAVDSGYWLLYRYNPELAEQGKNPFIWDSPDPMVEFKSYILDEIRYSSLKNTFPDEAKRLFDLAEKAAKERFEHMKKLKD